MITLFFITIPTSLLLLVILFSVLIVGVLIVVLILKRIKYFFKAFKKGYKMGLPLTENKTLLKNIAQIKEPNFENREKLKSGQKQKGSSYKTIRQEWKAIIEQNQNEIEQLYHRGIMPDWVECRTKMENDFAFEDEIYKLLVNWIERIDWDNLDEVSVLFKYIKLVSNGDYQLNALVLAKYHKRILASIKDLIQKEDFKIEDKIYEGNLGELIENLINLYFHHTRESYNKGYTEQFDLDRKEIAQILPDFIKAFPENCSNLTMHILENNTDNLVEVCADLLHVYITKEVQHNYSFTTELFGKYQKLSDPIYKNSATILRKTIQMSVLTKTQINYLIEEVLLVHLSINSQESQINEKTNHINRLEECFKDKVVEKYKKERAEFIKNFEAIFAKNWTKAVRRVAVSRSIFKSIEVLVKAFSEQPKTQILLKLLKEANTFKNKPKLYDLGQKPQILFKDLHFKYLVIEELMYSQEILKPRFDINMFAKEYSKREMDIEDEGYEIIPEVKKYFENLDISTNLLSKVTTLYQDSGFGGGSEFIYQLQPFWDPGAGDEVFKISSKAIEDLELLPNLKIIIGIENSNPSKKLVNAVEEKGIVLEKEDG